MGEAAAVGVTAPEHGQSGSVMGKHQDATFREQPFWTRESSPCCELGPDLWKAEFSSVILALASLLSLPCSTSEGDQS